jgi:hypothetical protein
MVSQAGSLSVPVRRPRAAVRRVGSFIFNIVKLPSCHHRVMMSHGSSTRRKLNVRAGPGRARNKTSLRNQLELEVAARDIISTRRRLRHDSEARVAPLGWRARERHWQPPGPCTVTESSCIRVDPRAAGVTESVPVTVKGPGPRLRLEACHGTE